MAIMGYLGDNGKFQQGKIEFAGRDLLSLSKDEKRQVWGAQMSLVPQNPLSSLNPSIRIGEQLAEILRYVEHLDQAEARSQSLELLSSVGLPDPQRVAESFPHQISGGMQQRVLIAMALSTAPRLLVLDEPTTSLDVTTQATILDLFRDLIIGHGTTALYVTHNLGVVAQICDRVAVLYAGELVEDAPLSELFSQPLHPYTQGLLDSIPKLGQNKNLAPLQSIQGQIPTLGARPSGCVFEPRCPLAIDICHQRPPIFNPTERRFTRCHRWEEISTGKINASDSRQNQGMDLERSEQTPVEDGASPIQRAGQTSFAKAGAPKRQEAGRPPALDIKQVSVYFSLPRSFQDIFSRRPARKVRAVDEVSFSVQNGKTVGLVGESGSGKTSLARAVVGLVEYSSGNIDLLNVPLPSKLSRRSLETLRHLQMVFQNPEDALNPYLTVGTSLRRPIMILAKKTAQEADAEVERLLAAVRLPSEYAMRMPGQLSGGEKQRIAIARAFATHPELLIADEPVSSLDVSVQASILNLLNRLQVEEGSALLFISHDLAVVGYLADEIAVVYLGRLMEFARSADLFEPPYHPYTEALLSAIPRIQPGASSKAIRLEGDIPSPTEVPTGCPFHTRCPRSLGEICTEQVPPWRVEEQTGKMSFCHIPFEELRAVQKKVIPS